MKSFFTHPVNLILLGLLVGLCLSIGSFVYILPRLPLVPDNPLYKKLGIQKPESVGFLPYWLIDKAEKNYSGKITTLAYFGLIVMSDGTIQKLANPQETEPGWNNLQTDKVKDYLKNARSKGITLSLVLQNGDEDSIADLVSDPVTHAKTVVKEAAPIMKAYGFSDLNLDIESFQPASDESRAHFTLFVKTVKQEMTAQNLGTLSLDIAPTAFTKKYLIEPASVGKMVDSLIIMGYDYTYSGSYIAGPVAPLSGTGTTRQYDVEQTINEALKKVSANKIILANPTYGYEWETINDIPGAPVIPGSSSTASNSRIISFLKTCAHCEKGIDSSSQEPYVVYPNETGNINQMFYEDQTSLEKKLQLAWQKKLKGVGVWALGYEDQSMLLPLSDYLKQYRFVE